MASINNTSAEMSSTNIQVSKKETILIVFDKSKKITYFGPCKVEINKSDKLMILKPKTVEKGFKEFTSTFNRIFVQKGNAVCVIDRTTNRDFMIIFPQKEFSNIIYNNIIKAKFRKIDMPADDPSTDDYLFKNNFYISILNEIQRKIVGYIQLKKIVLDLLNTFEADERQIYMNMIFEISMLPTNPTNSTDNNSNTVTAQNDSILNESLESNAQSLNETTTSIRSYSFRKRTHVNGTSQKSLVSDKSIPKPKKSRLSRISANDNFVTANYEIVECYRHGAVRKRLLLFTSDEKTHCYEYYYSKDGIRHQCIGCSAKKHSLFIKTISMENGKMKYQYGLNEHACQPTQYLPENYTMKESMLNIEQRSSSMQEKVDAPIIEKIAKVPNFKILKRNYGDKVSSKLIVYGENNQNLCREYAAIRNIYRCHPCKNKFKLNVWAKLVTDDEGNTVIEFGPNEHKCNQKSTKRIIPKSNFKTEIVLNKNGKEVKMITITDPEYNDRMFTYHFYSGYQSFCCRNCYNKRTYVKASFLKDQSDNECIELSDAKHVCI